MAKRKQQGFFDDLYDIFCIVPWWVGPLVAGVMYAGLRWIIPAPLLQGSGTVQPVTTLLKTVATVSAPWVALLTILAWLFSLLFKVHRRHILDQQRGLDTIREMTWQDFEKVVGEIYRRRGYMVAETGGGGADGGYDLALRRSGKRTLVQCKQWKSFKVGVKPVRELYGVMAAEKADSGIMVTTGVYTREAEVWAAGKSLEMVNGEKLWNMIAEMRAAKGSPSGPAPAGAPQSNNQAVLRPGVGNTDQTRTAEALVATLVPETPACPRCGGSMSIRTARKGMNAGSQFWGCNAFPSCRGIVNLVG